MADSSVGFHPVVARLYDPLQTYFERRLARPHREYVTTVANPAAGPVVELGVGTGANLPYCPDLDQRLVGVELDANMAARARDRLERSPAEMTLLPGDATNLPFEDDSVGTVFEVGLLCSVQDVAAALSEIERVLRPEGEFRFFDHVRADGLAGRCQDLCTPPWRRLAGNCHLNRDVERAIRATEGLSVREASRHYLAPWPIRHFVRGRASPTTAVDDRDDVGPTAAVDDRSDADSTTAARDEPGAPHPS